MRKKTPQDYADELLRMYRENAIPSQTVPVATEIGQPLSLRDEEIQFEDGTGGIRVNVTTLRRLYPVPNALVTIFTGNPNNMTVIETGTTDQSGKSGIFNLKTQLKEDSQQAQTGSPPPFSTYNVSVKSDGYVEQIAMNVPVFSGVISVQGIDLLPVSAAGGHTEPQIINEANDYNL